jgi:1-aminocyclopropane-1-carboxylate deaminase
MFIVVPVLKDFGYILENMKDIAVEMGVTNFNNLIVEGSYHFGGYAKTEEKLIKFIESFQLQYSVELDPIYSGKLFYAVSELAKCNYFKPTDKILIYHTGGLQGKKGFVERFPKYDYILSSE